jgi:ribosome-binding protein aMBF1 (putative translation factor)
MPDQIEAVKDFQDFMFFMTFNEQVEGRKKKIAVENQIDEQKLIVAQAQTTLVKNQIQSMADPRKSKDISEQELSQRLFQLERKDILMEIEDAKELDDDAWLQEAKTKLKSLYTIYNETKSD